MTRRRRYLLWGGELLALLTVLAMLLPLEARGANGFASPAFEAQWRGIEGAVPNFWGPVTTAREGQREAYAEGTFNGEPGQRLVQYFDKARMEQTTSGGNVTNGLLTVELKTGALQLGNSTFRQYTGAAVGLAGDVGTPGPTYAGLTQLPDNEAQQSGAVTRTYNTRTNTFTTGAPMTDPNMVFASYLSDPSGRFGQNIPKAFADFLQRIPGGATPAMGYPVSPAFLANVRVNGVDNVPVVIQAFERKVLTYTPSNAPAFQVEFGNIGQHYYQWRYVTTPGGGTPTTAPPTVPLTPFGTADSTGAALTATASALTATASAVCATATPVGAVPNATSVSVLPVCATASTAYVEPNSTAYASTVTAEARTYNATSTAIFREYYATSTAIANENTTYNATSTAIYRDYYATSTAIANATSTATANENNTYNSNYNATSTAIYRDYYATGTASAATGTASARAIATANAREDATIAAEAMANNTESQNTGSQNTGSQPARSQNMGSQNMGSQPARSRAVTTQQAVVATQQAAVATRQAVAATQRAIDGTVAAAVRATTSASGGQGGATGGRPSGSMTAATGTPNISATQTAQAKQDSISATGAAAATAGTINNNPAGRQSGPTIPPTPANAQAATAQAATAGANATGTSTASTAAAAPTAVPTATTAVPTATTAVPASAAFTPAAAPPMRPAAAVQPLPMPLARSASQLVPPIAP